MTLRVVNGLVVDPSDIVLIRQLAAAGRSYRRELKVNRSEPHETTEAFFAWCESEYAEARAAFEETKNAGGVSENDRTLEYMTASQAGELLDLTPTRIGQLLAEGALTGAKPDGRTWRVERASVETFGANRRSRA